MIGLTRKQAETFAFIKAYSAKEGTAPSYDEIAENAKLKSKSGVHRIITALEERQLIRRIPNRSRAIEVINPESDTLGFLSQDVLAIVQRTARANDMLPEMLVAQIVMHWSWSELAKMSKRRGTNFESVTPSNILGE